MGINHEHSNPSDGMTDRPDGLTLTPTESATVTTQIHSHTERATVKTQIHSHRERATPLGERILIREAFA
jgi:hypothetical protein